MHTVLLPTYFAQRRHQLDFVGLQSDGVPFMPPTGFGVYHIPDARRVVPAGTDAPFILRSMLMRITEFCDLEAALLQMQMLPMIRSSTRPLILAHVLSDVRGRSTRCFHSCVGKPALARRLLSRCVAVAYFIFACSRWSTFALRRIVSLNSLPSAS